MCKFQAKGWRLAPAEAGETPSFSKGWDQVQAFDGCQGLEEKRRNRKGAEERFAEETSKENKAERQSEEGQAERQAVLQVPLHLIFFFFLMSVSSFEILRGFGVEARPKRTILIKRNKHWGKGKKSCNCEDLWSLSRLVAVKGWSLALLYIHISSYPLHLFGGSPGLDQGSPGFYLFVFKRLALEVMATRRLKEMLEFLVDMKKLVSTLPIKRLCWRPSARCLIAAWLT